MTVNELVEFHGGRARAESRLAGARHFILCCHAQCPKDYV